MLSSRLTCIVAALSCFSLSVKCDFEDVWHFRLCACFCCAAREQMVERVSVTLS